MGGDSSLSDRRLGMRPRRHAALTATLALTLLSGCSSGAPEADAGPTPSPSANVTTADQSCRDTWAALGSTAKQQARAGSDVRQAFGDQWNAIAAGIDYYVQVADAGQCGDLLAARRITIETLSHVTARALPYDAGQRRLTAQALRPVYAAVAEKGREPKRVQRAYRTLTKQTTTASGDLAPAFDELARADPTDKKAVAQGISDIRLLAETSDAYGASSAALGVISVWQGSLVQKQKQKADG